MSEEETQNVDQPRKFDSADAVSAHLKVERSLENADLSELDLQGIKLAGISMTNADLHGSDLTKAKLAGLDMQGANLAGAVLTKANLAGVDLSAANLQQAGLQQARLMGVDLEGADLTGADLTGSTMVGVDVSGADFTDTVTTDATAAADWSEAKAPPAELPAPIQAKIPRWLPPLAGGALLLTAAILIWLRRRSAGQAEGDDVTSAS